MDGVIIALACLSAALTAGLYACVAASWRYFRPPLGPSAALAPMTLIKPLRGLDESIERNFLSIIESDPRARLQVIIAVESEQDPAYGFARAFAAAHPGRDILVLLTGPSGARMGKIHNMIEAYPKAKHPYVIFSDADVRTSVAMLEETSRAFQAGYDAAFGLPYHAYSPGLGGWGFMAAFNHYFCVAAALNFYVGNYRFCAGAWMAYTREILERIGGLEPFAHAIADDFALSRAASRAGARKYLLKELVVVEETGRAAGETVVHLAKWAAIIRCSVPWAYGAVPLTSAVLMSAVAWALCESAGRHVELGRGLLVAALVSRALVAWVQDSLLARGRMSWWGYVLLPFSDVGGLALWLSGFRSRIRWRGKTYLLLSGGQAKVVSS